MSAIYNPSPAFRDAAAFLSTANELHSVPNATKLELYAIYKFLTAAPTPSTPKPSIFDFAGKAKWDAWRSAGETYKDRPAEAESRYLEIARTLGWSEGRGKEAETSALVPAKTDGGSGNAEEDIWDSEAETARRKGERNDIGRVTSTLATGDEGSSSALSNLAISGDAQGVLTYLEEHPDVDVNALDENGYTPLHLAADRGHANVVQALLNRGADRNIKDEDELTAKELAEIAGHDEIVNLLSDTRQPPT
ncbi:ankyrin [Trametes elegans]|nr:ankyrin [Trametes elegans]